MPTTPRLLLAAGLALLALPAAASAADSTVSPGDSDVAAKVSAAGNGDTVTFTPGIYTVNLSNANPGVTLKGQPGALINGKATTSGTPVIAFTASSGAPDVVSGLTVVNVASSGPGISGGASGLTLRDDVVVSTTGDAADFGMGPNVVGRSQLDTTFAGAAAASLRSASPADTAATLTLDSTVLSGPKSLSAGYATGSLGPGITVTGHHVTAIGSISADPSGALLPGTAIAATFTDSIIRGSRSAVAASPAGPGATVTASTRDSVADTAADAPALFVNAARLNYHLRADAPVRGLGGFTSGESATDIDGNAVPSSGPTDLGADQFVNRPPTAVLAALAAAPRQNQAVTFDASGSTDPDAGIGGGITAYHWNFGDGTTTTTTTPTTTHSYSARQAYSVTVSVTDKQGATSAPSAPDSFTVLDGIPPTITVATPQPKQRLALYRTRRRHGKTVRTTTRRSVAFLGGAADDTALSKVYLALRPVASKSGVCRWFDGKHSLKSGPCTTPLLLTPTLLGGGWRYTLPLAAKLPVGAYDLYAVAIDASGLPSATTIVGFRFR